MTSDSRGGSESGNEGLKPETATRPAGNAFSRFYRSRNRFYTGLLAFVIVAGLPQIVVPSLRQRLQERANVLRENLLGDAGQPKGVVAKVGENPVPFPEEYGRLIQPIPQIPARIFPTNRIFRPVPIPPDQTAENTKARRSMPQPEIADLPVAQEQAEAEPSEPEFRQGKMEQAAFDILMQTNTTASGLVQGSNLPDRSKIWVAAKLDEDTYLVRITMIRDGKEVQYIWQVKLDSKQTIPLNFNARSLPKP